MVWRPAISIRNANGQVRQIATMTTETKAFGPMSQNGWLVALARCRSTRIWLSTPVCCWKMNFHAMMPAYIGIA